MSEEVIQFSCAHCGTVYSIGRERLGESGKITRCSVCSHVFVVRQVEVPPEPPASLEADAYAEPVEVAAEGDELEVSPPGTEAAIEPGELESEEEAGEFLEVGPAGDVPVAATEIEIGEDLPSGEELVSEGIEVGPAGDAEKAVEEPPAVQEPEPLSLETVDMAVSEEEAAVELDVPEVEEEPEPVEAEQPAIADTEIRERVIPPDIEMPSDEETAAPVGHVPVELEDLELEKEEKVESSATQRRWRDPMQPERRRAAVRKPPTESTEESTGTLYKAIILILGFFGLLTLFTGMPAFQIDPVWSATFIVLGLLSFKLQGMSGHLIAGLFGFFYPLALFSTQGPAFYPRGEWGGLLLLAAESALGAVIVVVYFLLMSRRRALFVLKEGWGQSLASMIMGLVAFALMVWVNLESQILKPFGDLAPAGTPLRDYFFYFYTSLPTLLLACSLSLAIAVGFSARAVRNRNLTFATVGLVLGFIALFFVYFQFQVLLETQRIVFSIGF